MDQWFLRITAYQDELVDDMAQLPQWPERVLQQQRNWVGRSHGAEVAFPVEGGEPLRIFTTRIDTIYGATFMVVAPEHPRVDEFLRGARDEAKAREAIQRLRGQRRGAAGHPAAPGTGPASARGGAGGEGRRLHRPPRHEPLQRGAHPD